MTCEEFEERLDDGQLEASMREHASSCSVCAALLRAAMEVESALAVRTRAKVNAGFNDAVMRAIHAKSESRWRRALAVGGQVFAEPFAAVSIAVASVVVLMRNVMGAAAASIASGTVDVLSASALPAASVGISLAVAILAISLLGGDSWHQSRYPARREP